MYMYPHSSQIEHCVFINTLDADELEKASLRFFFLQITYHLQARDLSHMKCDLRHTEMLLYY